MHSSLGSELTGSEASYSAHFSVSFQTSSHRVQQAGFSVGVSLQGSGCHYQHRHIQGRWRYLQCRFSEPDLI